jgi:hypothetical protein
MPRGLTRFQESGQSGEARLQEQLTVALRKLSLSRLLALASPLR